MRKQILFVCVILMTFFSAYEVRGQFADAVTPVYSSGVSPVYANATGNDIQDIAGVTYEVSVSDDQSNNSFLTWRVGTTIGFIQIGQGTNISNPDVCLVKNGANQVFAMVVYFNPANGEYWLQRFVWNQVAQSFNVQAQNMLSPGVFANTLQIASDDNGTFAIVWDEPGDQVRLIAGNAPAGFSPQLFQGGQVYNLQPGSYPDVCVFRSSITGDNQVHIVYVNSGGSLTVDTYIVGDLVNGAPNPNEIFRAPTPDLEYRNPKIACPASTYGKKEDFTVITEDTDGNSTWYIKGFNNNFNSSAQIAQHIYNDGITGNSPWNLTLVPNTKPSAAYDQTGDAIWVAWNVDNSFGMISNPNAPYGNFPIAISGGKRANIAPGAKFLNIPTGISFPAEFEHVSISGHKSSKVMFTFNDRNLGQIFSKSLIHAVNAPNVRIQDLTNDFATWRNEVLHQIKKNEAAINIIVKDLSGKTVYSGTSILDQKFDLHHLPLTNLSSGLYIVSLDVSGTTLKYTSKYLCNSNY
jgi:hypothetical protein